MSVGNLSNLDSQIQLPGGVHPEAAMSADLILDLYSRYDVIRKNYNSAIREVKTKLEVLNEDFELLHKHNPIHSMSSRVKTADSIIEKCIRMGYELEDDKFLESMKDIAGIRVICHYVEDIYTVARLLKSQPDIVTELEKDYIKTPKPNGYRSLHLVVRVPVFFVDGTQELPVEVQIRTMAMDFWASLEHKLRYKSNGTIPAFIARELKECAETISETDLKMQRIHSFLDRVEEDLTRR